ncbi:hypothetical protein WICMUC_004443 [Wickerhamomyces mucosus]|uniref:SET domain-containing protein n=1 Tax=Wickerhamomyces mucosus TaxID=1378264 RepID=A0A9P8TA63_9ASCO|nr:hypothetical protein WICMUC_004443 [Wickerhamomyces mucosus]
MTILNSFRERFITWCESEGSKISKFITFKNSDTEGTGVFLDLDQYSKENDLTKVDEEFVVLRIPKHMCLSLETIGENFLKEQLAYDLDTKFIRQGKLLSTFLSNFQSYFQESLDPFVRGGLNETNILVGELQMLVIIKIIREKLIEESLSEEYEEFLRNSPFSKLDQYLELLYLTEVNSVKLDEYYFEYLDAFKYNEREFRHRIEKVKSQAVLDALHQYLPSELFRFVDVNFLRRVEISVISRILEIPEPLEKDLKQEINEDYGDDKQENIEYGFAVSSTLVPVIDFVNHSNDFVNSYFDADEVTGDIILKLEPKRLEGLKGEVELFIQYSDCEDVLRFVHSYGFIPKSITKSIIYEHPISREYLRDYRVSNYSLANFFKWFQIQPNVQFVITYDESLNIRKAQLNLDENFIVFGFSKNLKYIKENALELIERGIGEVGEFSSGFIEKYLSLEESDGNDIISGYNGTPFIINRNHEINLKSLVENTSDEEINSLILDFLEFLVDYFKIRIDNLKSLNSRLTNKSSIISQFSDFEYELLSKFINDYGDSDDKLSLVLDADELDDEWVKLRLKPITVPVESRKDLLDEYLSKQTESLKIV